MSGRINLKGIINKAADEGILIPAFNVPHLPMAKSIARTLEKYKTFGMIEVARCEITKFEAKCLSAVAEEYNEWANPENVSLHLEHVPVIDEDDLRVDWKSMISEGIALGYNSVMIDGSRLPLDENIAVTAEVTAMAHDKGVCVEAELGAVMGHSAGPLPPYDEIFEKRIGFTDPEEARIFAEKTGVDWLSVSVGSFHGAISAAGRTKAKQPARLDIGLIKELRAATGIPLALHGGSGVIQSYVDDAIREGMIKINVATDIRQPYERTLEETGNVEEARLAVDEEIGRLIRDVFKIEGTALKFREFTGEI